MFHMRKCLSNDRHFLCVDFGGNQNEILRADISGEKCNYG